VDFNRGGTPLIEIVTEPDFRSPEEAKTFLQELRLIARYLGISDADMEKGDMRLEPNISLRLEGETSLPKYKVEVKNINSFRFVKQAIEYEVERQIGILEKGETPMQETRGFDDKKGITYGQRSKEEAHDYRYFPEPDIPPMTFSKKYIEGIEVPELPNQKVERYLKLGLRYSNAFTLTRNKKLNDLFEETTSKIKVQDKIQVTDIANLLINKREFANLSSEELYRKLKELKSPKQFDEKLLDTTINQLIGVNKKAVEDYKKGKENAIMFLVGQVMGEMKGKADAKTVISKLKAQMSNPNLKSKN